MVLVEATPESHRELASIQALDGKTWNHPALAGRQLYVRNDHEAARYNLPAAEGGGFVRHPSVGSVRAKTVAQFSPRELCSR